MVLKNASEYAPTFPSKYKNDELQLISGKTFSKEDSLKWQELPRKGYLYNGRKSAYQLTKNLLELNLCQSKVLKLDACFEQTETDEPVRMDHAMLREAQPQCAGDERDDIIAEQVVTLLTDIRKGPALTKRGQR